MTTQTITHCRFVNVPFDLCGIFVGMAVETQLVRNGRDQLYPGHIFADPYLVAAQASHLDGAVH